MGLTWPTIDNDPDPPSCSTAHKLTQRWRFRRWEARLLLTRRVSPPKPRLLPGYWYSPEDMAIENQQDAIDLMPTGDSVKPERLSELARLLICRFESQRRARDLDTAIKNQQAAVDLTRVGDSNKIERLDVLAGLFMRRFEGERKLEDLESAIKNQQAAVDLTPAGDSNKLERLDVLVGLLTRYFEDERGLEDIDRRIKDQQAIVDLTPAGDSDKPECLGELARLLMRRFERKRMLEAAIKYRQAAVDLTPVGDSAKIERLGVLGRLSRLSFEHRRMFDDLDWAIKNQQDVVDLTPEGGYERPERLYLLAELLMHRFESKGTLADLDGAIWIYRAGVVLTPEDYEWDRQRRQEHLEGLVERRLKTVGDRNREMGSWLSPSAAVPTMLGGVKTIHETVKDKLVEDLQQLSVCIKKPRHRELATTLLRMEHAIVCLKFHDGDKLCQDIFKASTRLGAYCQALRNRAEDKTNQRELEDLYEDFVRIEREFSAAHDGIRSKYEQLYKQWKAERQSISKFLSKADSAKSQRDNLEVWALVEQVDAGFEKMGDILKNEANDLKNLSENLDRLSKMVHHPPDPPIASDDPAQPPDPPSTPSKVSTQVDDVIAALSQVDALVEKSRYTKARQIVSETSSKTTQKLKKLRTSSEDYEEESRTLSCLRNRHDDHSRDIRNRQRELCDQLSSLVGGMRRMLKGIEKGFSGCKVSLQGLIFTPLGDLLCDLEPYMAQAGLEVSCKGLHPDLILYEAAFQAIADSIPEQSAVLEHIKGSLSVLDRLRGV